MLQLPEPKTGKEVTFADVRGEKATLVMILSNHCPFVVLLKEAIASLTAEYASKGVGAVGICSNSVQTHPQDGPHFMAQDAEKYGYSFPYLYDESQDVAKACTSPRLLAWHCGASLQEEFCNWQPFHLCV